MKKYIDAEKLKTEIRIIQQSLEHRDVRFNQVKRIRTECMIEFCKCIFDVIASLQQEQPDKYETALEKAKEWMPNVNQGGLSILIDIFPELGEGLDPRYGGRKQGQPEVDFEKEFAYEYAIYHLPTFILASLEDGTELIDFIYKTARHFAEWGAIHHNTRKEE